MKQLPVPAVAAATAATAADNHFLRIKRPALIAHSINKQIIIIMHMGGRGTSGNKMRMAYGSFAIILSFFLSTFLHSPPHSKRSNKNGTIKRNENAKKKIKNKNWKLADGQSLAEPTHLPSHRSHQLTSATVSMCRVHAMQFTNIFDESPWLPLNRWKNGKIAHWIAQQQSMHLIDINLFGSRARAYRWISPAQESLHRHAGMTSKRKYGREPFFHFISLFAAFEYFSFAIQANRTVQWYGNNTIS